MGKPESTLRAAVRVREALDRKGVPCALIGALALAVHGYTREAVCARHKLSKGLERVLAEL